jgi:GNAT superfamily N-acetyltransferase
MRREDFPFAVSLANTMDWNMAESDFDFTMGLEPDGCFVLWQGQERVGIATCISYGKIGWFGNLAVKEEHRRKGAGTFLVKHAVDYLRSKGVENVGLYAYQHLVGFYARVGFQPLDQFVVFNGQENITKQQAQLKEARKRDIPALVELDKRCLGWERQRLIDSILREKRNLCHLHARRGSIVGFVMAKVYDEMAEIGPLVCRGDDAGVAVNMLTTMLNRLRGLDVYVCVPAKEKSLVQTLLSAGLKERFRLTRMFLGVVAAQSCVYVPESIERG